MQWRSYVAWVEFQVHGQPVVLLVVSLVWNLNKLWVRAYPKDLCIEGDALHWDLSSYMEPGLGCLHWL